MVKRMEGSGECKWWWVAISVEVMQHVVVVVRVVI